jgi:hypothetical protein
MPPKSTEDKKAYQASYHKKRYAEPEYQAKQKATAKIHKELHRNRNKQYIDEYRMVNPCACGESDIVCLDFHHIGNKSGNISDMAKRPVSIAVLQAEMDKCIVICRNCHAKLHAKMKDDEL